MGDMADWILEDESECPNCGCLMKCRCKDGCEQCGTKPTTQKSGDITKKQGGTE